MAVGETLTLTKSDLKPGERKTTPTTKTMSPNHCHTNQLAMSAARNDDYGVVFPPTMERVRCPRQWLPNRYAPAVVRFNKLNQLAAIPLKTRRSRRCCLVAGVHTRASTSRRPGVRLETSADTGAARDAMRASRNVSVACCRRWRRR